jgi:ABC-2 type transport system ATP-binding protein
VPTFAPTSLPTTSSGAIAPPTSPPSAPGYVASVPALPAAGACRTGETYSDGILTPTGDTEVFTVFEPATLCAAQTYPLVMWGPGYAGSRETSTSSSSLLSPGNIGDLVNAGYGVVSIDERGFGDDTGTARSMDPNFEGLMDLSVMDWAQANLTWIKYGPTLEGDDPHEPVMGSVGGSYGGMYQLMLLDIDKRHRLHAIVPQITPYDLNYSLYPNTVVKDNWDLILYGAGYSGGSLGTGYGHEDPFLTQDVVNSVETNVESPAEHDFFGYHSDSYFCNGTPIATDGPGYSPIFAPNHPPKINAMMWQGMRDTLFTFNNAYNNYMCLKQGGGDVRLFTYQSGHNSLQGVPDPYMYEFYSPTDDLSSDCGSLDVDTATTAFFNQYLKGMPGAANSVPTGPCLSFSTPLNGTSQAVLVPSVTTGHAGTHYSIPTTYAVAGAGLDTPISVPLGSAFTAASVVGGLPRLEVTITPVVATGEPILFFGIGQTHASQPGTWDLIDNQLTPVRGSGPIGIDMTGIAAQLAPGDSLSLLIFGLEDQYTASGNVNAANPTIVPVTVSGDLWVPLISNPVAAP